MSYKVYARHGGAVGASQDDITDRVPAFDGNQPILQMGMSCQTGSASQGTMIVPDPTGNLDASLYFPPHTQITWTDDASGDELWLARGRISGWSVGRPDYKPGDSNVEWTVTVDDGNVDLRGLAFTADWVRPAETGTERLYALALYTLNGTSSTRPTSGGVISYRPSTDITIDPTHLAPDTNTTVMPAKTYRIDTQPLDVVTDCAETEGKIFGVVLHHTGGSSHLCLLYVRDTDHSTYASTCKISDDLSDWDPEDLTAPIFEPIYDQGDAQRVDGNANISGIVSRYGPDDKAIVVLNATLGNANEYWVEAVQDGRSVDPTQAAARAASVVASRAPYLETDSVSIHVLAEQHHLICAGMSLQIKAAPVNTANTSTIGSYVYRRIVSLQWEPLPDGRYHGILQLNRPMRAPGGGAAQPASTSPTGAPDCGDTMPVGFALFVDDAGWTKQDDPDYPVPGPSIPNFKAINVAASGTSAILSNLLYGNFDFSPDPPGFHDWYTGGYVTKDGYAPTNPEEMLFRFTVTTMGEGIGSAVIRVWFQTGNTISRGAAVYMPDPTVPHDGLVEAVGGAVEPFTLVEDQSYWLRWKGGDVYLWEVGDTEPVTPTAAGGTTTGTGGLGFRLDGAYDIPSIVEIESVTVFQAINDPFCLDDPGDSPYYAKSDDPRFDTIVTDHGGLTGLLDDDHTQYIKDSEFALKGDLLAGTGTGTFDNLGAGSDGLFLKANSGASTGLSWDNPSASDVEVSLINKSGGTVNDGDLVIVDTANDDAFKTTTTAAIETSIGVAQQTIANNASGNIALSGYVGTLNTNGVSVTRGHYLFHAGAAKYATANATRGPGAFGQVLTTGADPDAWLWGVADQSGGTVTEIEDLPTAETDTSLVLHPDGGGGIAWGTDATGGSGLGDHTHTATGTGSNGGGNALDVNGGTLRIPVGTGALTTTEGYLGWQSTTERLRIYDGQRERGVSAVGWTPSAYPLVFVASAAFTTALSLPANGGCIAIPMVVPAHMLCEGAEWRNTDTTLSRTVDCALYENRLNNGNGAENTVDRIAVTASQLTYTATGASIKGIDFDPIVYLPPGVYWLVIQNQHASNTYGIGSTAASSAFARDSAQTSTLGNPFSSTEDFSGWSKVTAMYAARLYGRVFGETTPF